MNRGRLCRDRGVIRARPRIAESTEWIQDWLQEPTRVDSIENDLCCPVCLNTFDDPCFVCSNHHTLCRGCYNGIVSRESASNARCPQCRERLTRPVENSQMLSLIKARHQPPARRPRRATCEATVGDSDEDAEACQRRATSRCEHCNRDLCDWHFSADQLEFQTDCRELLEKVEKMASEAKREEMVLTAWDSQIDDCINFLQLQRQQFRLELTSSLSTAAEEAAPASSSKALCADAVALRAALNSGDLGAAKAASDRLATAASNRSKVRRSKSIAAVPTPEQTSHLIDVELANFVSKMQQVYRNAALGESKTKRGNRSQPRSDIDEDPKFSWLLGWVLQK